MYTIKNAVMKVWKDRFGKGMLAIVAACAIVSMSVMFVQSAVTNIAGLAVAQDNPAVRWNNVRDGAAGDNLANGVMAVAIYGFDGSNFDRIPGDASNGLTVNMGTAGTAFFAIKDEAITTVSQNQAFGFTSDKVSIELPGTNTDEVCIDWLGGTAVCPASDTAGDDRMAPGTSVILDTYAVSSISVIAASGTQTVFIRAWQ